MYEGERCIIVGWLRIIMVRRIFFFVFSMERSPLRWKFRRSIGSIPSHNGEKYFSIIIIFVDLKQLICRSTLPQSNSVSLPWSFRVSLSLWPVSEYTFWNLYMSSEEFPFRHVWELLKSIGSYRSHGTKIVYALVQVKQLYVRNVSCNFYCT